MLWQIVHVFDIPGWHVQVIPVLANRESLHCVRDVCGSTCDERQYLHREFAIFGGDHVEIRIPEFQPIALKSQGPNQYANSLEMKRLRDKIN